MARSTSTHSTGGFAVAATVAVALVSCSDPGAPPSPDAAQPHDVASAPAASAATSVAAPYFVDVAAASGLSFVHRVGVDGRYRLPEIIGSGCAWGDFDLDGDLDAYLVSAGDDADTSRNRLFRNDLERPGGSARFVDVSGASGADDAGFGMGCALGDIDGDGDIDLYVTNSGPNRLLRNLGGLRFEDVTEHAGTGDPSWSASAAFVDIDGDDDLDLWVVNYLRYRESAEPVCFDGAGRPEYCGPNTRFPPAPDSLWRNDGAGRFVDVTADAGLASVPPGNGLGITAADFDDDGDVDVYVANDASPNHLWINDGGGRFVERAVDRGCAYNRFGQAEAGMGVVAGDVDGDGVLDILITHLSGETHTLYRGLGDARFDDATARSGLALASRDATGFGAALADFDHDGRLDLLVTNGRVRRATVGTSPSAANAADLLAPYAQRDQLFAGAPRDAATAAGAALFVEVGAQAGPSFATPHVGRGLAAGDFDLDGDLDVLITACGGVARLLRNDAPKRGSWLVVDARRRDGRAPACGARVVVRAGERRFERIVAQASSYLSAGDPRAHFGLGDAERVDVVVRWPGGATSERRGVAVGRTLRIVEGE